MQGTGVTDPGSTRPRSTAEVAVIAVGLGIVAVGMLIVKDGDVPAAEESVFRAVNDLPEWLYSVVWPFQQLGALVIGPVVAVIAVSLRRYRLAIAAVMVTVAKLVAERVVKAIVSRERPGTSIGPDIEARGDVSRAGESFVSGHAVLVAGLAVVITPYLPGRWKVVPWVVVGAVMFGRVYVGAHNPLDVVCGAALGIAIGAVVNLATGAPRHRNLLADSETVQVSGGPAPTPRSGGRPTAASRIGHIVLGGSVVAAGALVGCADDANDSAASSSLTDDVITVGSFDFAESVVLAEVYSQGLEAAGYKVERSFSLGPREFVGPALTAGLVELVPEYAGTASEFHSLGDATPTDDVEQTHGELEQALAGASVTVLAGAPAQNANTFVVSTATARRHDLETVSDLAEVGPDLVFGGPAECSTRRHCLEGLADVYSVDFGEFVALDAGGPLTRQAVVEGSVDVALMFTTDPWIEQLSLVELTDDRGLQPAENVTPLVRTEIVDRWGEDVADTIDAVSARLTTQTVRDLNEAADADADIATIVAAWWSEEHS